MASYITEFPSDNTSFIENDDSVFNRYEDSSFSSHLCYELTDISDGKQSVNSTRTTAAWNKTEGFKDVSTIFCGICNKSQTTVSTTVSTTSPRLPFEFYTAK